MSIYPTWSGSSHQILYTIGSRSPHTKRIGRYGLAPLSLFLFTSPSREQKLRPIRTRVIKMKTHTHIMASLFLMAFSLLIFSCGGGSINKQVPKDATYTIRIDDIFEHNHGLVTEMDVTVYECNESGATVYENNITFNADGSRDFVAQGDAKTIKVLVEIHSIDPTRLASHMYRKANAWLPMAYALNPDRNTVVTMNRQTNWSNIQP